MIRCSEAVLDGHPDKFCDQLADTLLDEASRHHPGAYGQVECGIWSNRIWVSGLVAAPEAPCLDVLQLAQATARRIGYLEGGANDPALFAIDDHLCRIAAPPQDWTAQPNDQCIVIGWAGYDACTHYLSPEHFLVHSLRQALADSCRGGSLLGCGPDGKLLVRLREEPCGWTLEHVLVTLQHADSIPLLELAALAEKELARAYEEIRAADPRWQASWCEVRLLVNPHGRLVEAGSLADNGQTGRKLAMDFYGPRVPIGGGALSGKDLTHIDRAAAYAARKAAVEAVHQGARSCQITLCYSPGIHEPLDVRFDIEGRAKPPSPDRFHHAAITSWLPAEMPLNALGRGVHFFDSGLPWNQP